MAHSIGLRGSQGGSRASMGFAIALSLLVFTAVEGSHAHAEDDLSAVCYVCNAGHQGAPASVADTPLIVEPGVLHAPALPVQRLIPAVIHLSPHRSRAPPLPISP